MGDCRLADRYRTKRQADGTVFVVMNGMVPFNTMNNGVHDQSVIETTVSVWKREGAIEVMQSEYLLKNGKIRYMVACGGNGTNE